MPRLCVYRVLEMYKNRKPLRTRVSDHLNGELVDYLSKTPPKTSNLAARVRKSLLLTKYHHRHLIVDIRVPACLLLKCFICHVMLCLIGKTFHMTFSVILIAAQIARTFHCIQLRLLQ